MSGFYLGRQSEENLRGVIPPVVNVTRRAILLTTQDFGVYEGLRSEERQRKLFLAGASRTMKSMHLSGQAVDLLPYVDKRLQWQAPLSYPVARAMRAAAIELEVPLVWGGVWDRQLASLDPDNLPGEVRAYASRYRAMFPDRDEGPLIDPWHFQYDPLP